MRELIAEPITPEAFAPFGIVLDPDASARQDFIEELVNGRAGAKARLSLGAMTPVELPLTAIEMERHPFSSQAFVPRDVSRYLILVAPPNPNGPDLDAIRAFVVPGSLGIIYGVDVWHHPMRAIDKTATFAIVTFVDGTSDDEEFRPLPEPILVGLE